VAYLRYMKSETWLTNARPVKLNVKIGAGVELKLRNTFDVCVTVHLVQKRREVPTCCNNCDLLS